MGIDQYLEMVDTVVKPNGLSYLPTFLILSKILVKIKPNYVTMQFQDFSKILK